MTRDPGVLHGIPAPGHETEFTPRGAAEEVLAPGVLIQRYAPVEAQIHAAPADWPWSRKRWKLK